MLRWLAPGYEQRALSDLVQLRGQLRLAAIVLLLVGAPALLLAGLALSSSRGQELAVWEEVRRGAELAADAAHGQSKAMFDEFEGAVRQRLASGRSASDAPAELSPYLLVAFRVDSEGRVKSPFERSNATFRPEADPALHPRWREATRLEQTPGQAEQAAAAWKALIGTSRGVRAQALAHWGHARSLAGAGQEAAALSALDNISRSFAQVRDVHSFRLGDLARLKRGQLLLRSDPEQGTAALTALVEELISARWTIGQGGEHALASRALELLEDHAAPDWLSAARGRLEDRTRALFHAELLVGELDVVTGGGASLRVSSQEFAYRLTQSALWCTLWWGDDLYAFALDRAALVRRVSELGQLSTAGDENLTADVVGPEDAAPELALSRRTLAPWLPGWAIVVHPSAPDRLYREQRLRQTQSMAVVVLAVVLIALGGVLSVRVVGRELDIAHMKTDFAANVSHELRSPITQIRVKGEALMLGLYEDEADLQQTYEAIVRESERLSRLVDNVLDFSSIERGAKRYNLRPLDLGETVRAAVEAARYSMETRGMVLELGLPEQVPVVAHDPEAIAQVLQNLISNAAKYGRAGGWIGVKLAVLPEEVLLTVADRGIGIAEDQLPLIFDRFYRSPDPLARRQKGTGLGLTIVRYIIEAHGGTVDVRSSLGQGTTFGIHFPLQRHPARA